MHVSYRRPVELFVGTTYLEAGINYCDAGRIIVEVPIVLRRCQRPKVAPSRYLRDEIDLQNHFLEQVGGRHLGVLWETLGALLEPQGTPGSSQGTPRGSPGDSQGSIRGATEVHSGGAPIS